MQTWGEPDERGIRILRIDVGAFATIRARRKRRCDGVRLDVIDSLPAPWRETLRKWIVKDLDRRRWPTLLGIAGRDGAVFAHDLAMTLLENGLVEVEESRNKGSWDITLLRFVEVDGLRKRLGVEDPRQVLQDWEQLCQVELRNEGLQKIRNGLGSSPSRSSLVRLRLLVSLDDWVENGLRGTERDFALYARGDTKGISSAEWKWLKSNVELCSFGISPHTPVVFLRAPLVLLIENDNGCHSLDLAGIPDFSALSPPTISLIKEIQGEIDSWFVYENRTSFERGAKLHGQHAGVVWIPGFAPSWWMDSMDRFLKLKPAPGKISCDLDPSGIRIAHQAAQLWERNGISWSPWQMSDTDLRGLEQVNELSEADLDALHHLKSLPLHHKLKTLAATLGEMGIKGEQEGLPST